nr:S49 family peptidase [Kibdelosporangium sp. MJ126-NF4]CEL16114.1 possible signal peptide peptidase [Kibdelosporangium sp. MJ126-NF4]CTQ94040.1 possible signal peptide peptidase [Kibdelosporangium sp. MJ126-NF4]
MSVTEKLVSRLPGLGDRIDRKPVVAVIKLHGVITPTPSPLGRGSINLNSVESALTRAFDHDRLVAVALQVNSPGGAPTQSALVAERIRQLAARKNVPVIAFCEDVAASGGYWLACAADEIYAHSTSLVGSIGVISAGFGLSGLLERVGVERRVHTAGTNKMRLDPFQVEKPEDVEWLVGLQGQLHTQFVDWVSERRGGRLSKDHDDVFSGEVWTGPGAVERGLVDSLGTLRGVLSERYPDAEVVVAEPRRPLLARLGVGGGAGVSSVGAGILDAAIRAVEQRATWSRFGL